MTGAQCEGADITRVLACPDKFRGTLSAPEVAAAIAAALGDDSTTRRPLADGGEGTVDAFGGPNRTSPVTGPLGAPVSAAWRLDDGTAVIEAASACGLLLAGGADGNDPLAATTRGVGELLAEALHAGATRVLLGIGGSATTDGGSGALEALGGADLTRVEACCDVTTPFTRAAEVFGPQKGADAAQRATLTERLRRYREQVLRETGVDLDEVPGSGAAGGLAGGLASRGARLVPGFDTIADLLGLDDDLAAADLVITGEGRLDETSLHGKVVGGVLHRARAAARPVLVICGVADVELSGTDVAVLDLSARFGHDRAWADPAGCISGALGDANVLSGLLGRT